MTETVSASLRCPKCRGKLKYSQAKRSHVCGVHGKVKEPLDIKQADKAVTVPLGRGVVVSAPDNFDLYLTSDWHCGSNVCDYKGLHSMISQVQETRSARMIIGGDQMEMTPPLHHDGGRESTCYPDEQIIRTSDALKKCADRIDLIYSGNHGRARLSSVHVDPDLILAYTLGANYSTVPTVVQYRTPSGVIKIAGGHGKAGGKNGLLEVERLRNIFPGCDLYHLGHNHQLFAEQAGAMEFDEDGYEHWSGTWFCRTGSFMKYAHYARFAVMAPQPTGWLVAKIRKGKIADVEVVKA